MRNKWDMSGADDVSRYIPLPFGTAHIPKGFYLQEIT